MFIQRQVQPARTHILSRLLEVSYEKPKTELKKEEMKKEETPKTTLKKEDGVKKVKKLKKHEAKMEKKEGEKK